MRRDGKDHILRGVSFACPINIGRYFDNILDELVFQAQAPHPPLYF